MNADFFFSIGKTHEVCQDYAKSGTLERCGTYAIVSDGCSSSPDTDFGARFMTMAAIHYRSVYGETCGGVPFSSRTFDPAWIAWRASEMVRPPLSSQCLDATLLGIFEEPEGVVVAVAGDGTVIARRRDQGLEIKDFDFLGAPGYPSYLRNPARLEAYYKEGYGQRIVTSYPGDSDLNPVPRTDIYWFSPDFPEKKQYNIFDGPCALLYFPKDKYEMVMVVSDGAHSFQDAATLNPIPLLEVLDNLVGIKSYTGQFVTRRCKAFEKFCAKQGWHHNDDLGVAAVYLGDKE